MKVYLVAAGGWQGRRVHDIQGGRMSGMFNNYAGDCIHLHACRLMAKRYRNAGCKHVARHCDDECICYQTFQVVDEIEYIDPDVASRIAKDAVSDLAYGYSEDDLQVEIPSFIAANMETREIGFIVNGLNCTDSNGLDFDEEDE